jgi:excisionase family DNA binding protein
LTERRTITPRTEHPANSTDPPWLAELHQKLDALMQASRGNRKPLLTVEEVAGLTGRSAYTVRRWVKQKLLTARRIDGAGPKGRLLIDRSELDRLLRQGLAGRVPPVALSSPSEGSP